ncbi:hypothetical protein PIROE2DRAFT_9670 [Piromyces sp. E2]|nr:hypothetical protein PIROE2DRAFT_9670 [Piromyces sp. E2]|eukprot:OUM63732.1 hypothetical protein PIROE2DRAFT_9670 [Piromyces sp. E2]
MKREKKKRSNEDSLQDSPSESINKKRKISKENDIIIKKFFCGNFYIDKSLLIKEFLEESSNIISSEEDIYGQNYVDSYQGKYPVIYLDFKTFAVGKSYNETINNFKKFVKNLYKNYNIQIIKLDDDDQETWKEFRKGNINDDYLEESISFLCESLNRLLEKQVVLLIDNYDLPILNAFNTKFYDKFYYFYKKIFMNVFEYDKQKYYLFKTFITGKFRISFLEEFTLNIYSVIDDKYNEYYCVSDSEFKKLLSKLKLESKIGENFEKNCNNIYSYVNSTDRHKTNIFISSSLINSPVINTISTTTTTTTNDNNFNNNNNNNNNNNYNNNSNNNNNNTVKNYEIFYVINYIKNIDKPFQEYESYKLECLKLLQDVFNMFKEFDTLIIKDMNYLLQNGNIEKELLNIDVKNKDNFNNNRENFIWPLLIDSGFLIIDSTNKKLKIRNKTVENIIINFFSEWKKKLYKEKIDIIDSFINNYDERKIKEFLEIDIKKNENIRELLYVNKKYHNLLNSDIIENNKNYSNDNKKDHSIDNKNAAYNDNKKDYSIDNNKNNNKNESKKDLLWENQSEIFYITIINVIKINQVEKGCIKALDDNEDFIFNDCKLKDKYDKIIKFGIAFNENICEVMYDINYRENFKREEMPKEIYTGEFFERFNANKFYFVDKTRMISKLVGKDDYVFLITRPRRFGKSLNLKMVKEFFEKPNDKNNNRNNLFDGLEVSKNRKNMRDFHRYPVIYLNFKADESKDHKSAFEFLKSIISDLFKYYKERIKFDDLEYDEKEVWNKIENQEVNETTIKKTIKTLMKYLQKLLNKKSIVLIDEYDKIIINSLYHGYYNKINGIIKGLFSETFKDNQYLYFGIMTGCLDIGLQDVFSGFNNYRKHTLLYDSCYADCYGFTKNELNKILSFFGISKINKERIADKYDGYSCISNNKEYINNLYNPYSIMNFINDNKESSENYYFGSYWINSGSNTILNEIIYKNNFFEEKDFFELINRNIIKVNINENLIIEDNFRNVDIKKDKIWTFLIYSGYITVTDEKEYNNQKNNQTINLYSNENILTEDDDSNTIMKIQKEVKTIMDKNNKIDNEIYYIKIPNNEVLKIYEDIFKWCINKKLKEAFGNNRNVYIKNFIKGIFEKDVEKINKNLTEYLKIFSPYQIYTTSGLNENVYQVLLMQMFAFFEIKDLTAEENSGYGRYDFGFPNKPVLGKDKKEYILIEVKAYRMNNTINNKNNNDNNNENNNDYEYDRDSDSDSDNNSDDYNKKETDKKNINTKKNIKKSKKNKPITKQQKIKNILYKESIDGIKQIETKDYALKYRNKGYTSFNNNN